MHTIDQTETTPPPPPAFYTEWRYHIALILVLGLLAYIGTLNAPFQWDDRGFIASNPAVKDISVFLDETRGSALPWYANMKSRPVTYLTFWLNYKISALSPMLYHAVNILIHLSGAALLYFLIIMLFETPRLRESELLPYRGIIGLGAALLFVLHPLQTEAVTYIFQRHASLAALLYIFALTTWLYGRLQEGPSGWKWIIASVCLSALAMKSKENALTLPLMILLMEGVFFSGDFKRLKYSLPVLPTLLIIPLSLVGIMGDKGLRGPGLVIGGIADRAAAILTGPSSGEYFLTQLAVVATYLRMLILPYGQSIDHDYPLYDSLTSLPVIGGLALHTVLIGAALLMVSRLHRRKPEFLLAGFGILWFYLTLSVESSVIPIPMVMNEYRVYLPSAGLFLSVMALALMAATSLRYERNRAVTVVTAVALIVAGLYGIMTVKRNRLWTSPVALWQDAALKAPGKPRTLYNYGVNLEAAKRLKEALIQYDRVLALDPKHINALYNKGYVLQQFQLYDEAEKAYRRVLELDPSHGRAKNNIGVLLENSGRTEEARNLYETALSEGAASPQAYYNLGVRYLEEGRNEEAARMLGLATGYEGTTREIYDKLALAYYRSGNMAYAVKAYTSSVSLAPNDPDARMNLGIAYYRTGDYGRAITEFLHAIAIKPDKAIYHYNLGVSYEGLKQFKNAEESYHKSISLDPKYIDALYSLGNLYDRSGQETDALSMYLRVLDINPDHANTLNNAAVIIMQQGRQAQAIRYLERAVRADKRHADAWNNLGILYYNANRRQDALKALQQAVALSPENQSFQQNLSLLQQSMKK